MNKIIIFCAIFILILLSYIIYKDNINENNIKKICFEEKCFDLEIAEDDKERAKGLMFRKSLCDNCGMLFIFENEEIHKFWMKNTLISLDIIWMDKNLKVIFIDKAIPCIDDKCELYGHEKDSSYALEINKGVAEKIGIKAGDRMRIIYK